MLWAAITEAYREWSLRRPLPPAPQIPDPMTLHLSEIATAIWLPHNESRSVPVVPLTVAPTGELVTAPVAAAVTSVPSAGVTTPGPVGAPAVPSSPASPSASSESPPVAPPVSVSSQGLSSEHPAQAFVQSFVTPYEGLLRQQGVFEPIMTMIRYLDAYGDCPSIVVMAPERDQEAADLHSVKQALLRVSLRDHTYHVADFALRELKQRYRDGDPLIPKVLVAALGHDLGKAPHVRTATLYTMGDHTAASAVQVQTAFQGLDIAWLPEVVTAITAHHRPSKEPLDVLLKSADAKARQYEISRLTPGTTILPWEEWCQLDPLLQYVAKDINMLSRQSSWKGVSLGTVVYVVPDTLLDAARALARERRVIDMSLIRSDEREPALRRLVDLLRKADVLGGPVGEGYYGRYYQILSSKRGHAKRLYLVPVKKEAFGAVAESFEERKQGILTQIHDIQPTR